jgi:hypothetical protein
MVRYGFALSEIRQLYIDEVLSYFEQLVSLLEREGVLKAGTSSQLSDQSPVEMLKNQLKTFKSQS